MFEEWLPEGSDTARRTRSASLAADAEGRMAGPTKRKDRMRQAEDGGFLREQVGNLLHETARLLERVALVEQEILGVRDETAPNDHPRDSLTAAQSALAELHALDPAALEQAGMFTEMLLQVAREGKRLSSAVFGERNGAARLTETDVRSIRRCHGAGESIRALARRYGVSTRTIRDIVRRQTWRRVV